MIQKIFIFLIILFIIISIYIFHHHTNKEDATHIRIMTVYEIYKDKIIKYDLRMPDLSKYHKMINIESQLDHINEIEFIELDINKDEIEVEVVDDVVDEVVDVEVDVHVDKKEVFNISDNIFNYEEANAVCKAFGSELATVEQMKDAYEDGANWCNNGWTNGMNAVYPIQKEYHEHQKYIQNDSCGYPGINGGFYPNPKVKLSANCYGIKPKPDSKRHQYTSTPIKNISPDLYKKYEKMVKKQKFNVNPFNDYLWNDYSEKPSIYLSS